MSSNVGPKGRLYRRERLDGIWVAITIIAMNLHWPSLGRPEDRRYCLELPRPMTAPGFRFDLVCRLDRNELDLAFPPYVARAI